jgi:hypothetical protein
LRRIESLAKKGYDEKTAVSTRALKASSCVKAGEKVLDSMAKPAMAIRGSVFSDLLELQEVASISKQKIKTK